MDEDLRKVTDAIRVERIDIQRAKTHLRAYADRHPSFDIDGVAEEFAGRIDPRSIVDLMGTGADGALKDLGRMISLRLACYQAAWELVQAGYFLPSGISRWTCPSISVRKLGNQYGLSPPVDMPRPERLSIPPVPPTNVARDVDLLLDGFTALASIHGGIREALEQAVACLRIDLFLPAVAMIAAAAEAQWIECGLAAAAGDGKIQAMLANPHVGIGKVVDALCDYFISGAGVAKRKAVNVTPPQLSEAQNWTVVLRDQRNALHWSKAGSFTVTYGRVSTLLLAAPIHLSVLEQLRTAP